MKIKSVKISNILSFAYCENFDVASAVEFKEGINILIWPKGSGKKSFIKILKQIMQKFLFCGYSYRPDLIDNLTEQKNVLQRTDKGSLSHLSKHWDYPEKEMRA